MKEQHKNRLMGCPCVVEPETSLINDPVIVPNFSYIWQHLKAVYWYYDPFPRSGLCSGETVEIAEFSLPDSTVSSSLELASLCVSDGCRSFSKAGFICPPMCRFWTSSKIWRTFKAQKQRQQFSHKHSLNWNCVSRMNRTTRNVTLDLGMRPTLKKPICPVSILVQSTTVDAIFSGEGPSHNTPST